MNLARLASLCPPALDHLRFILIVPCNDEGLAMLSGVVCHQGEKAGVGLLHALSSHCIEAVDIDQANGLCVAGGCQKPAFHQLLTRAHAEPRSPEDGHPSRSALQSFCCWSQMSNPAREFQMMGQVCQLANLCCPVLLHTNQITRGPSLPEPIL